MIIERNTFHLKFGKAKEAIGVWNELLAAMKKMDDPVPVRMLTDLSGHSYTLVVEVGLKSFMDINVKNYHWVTNTATHDLYQKFIPLCQSSHREYYKIEMEI